uniref:Chitin-binding type-2 domain-containing protein n=1 Tax=Cacopsylla melanoneura TaxID=428564 RepID=A0A8D8RBV2_9HEMI
MMNSLLFSLCTAILLGHISHAQNGYNYDKPNQPFPGPSTGRPTPAQNDFPTAPGGGYNYDKPTGPGAFPSPAPSGVGGYQPGYQSTTGRPYPSGSTGFPSSYPSTAGFPSTYPSSTAGYPSSYPTPGGYPSGPASPSYPSGPSAGYPSGPAAGYPSTTPRPQPGFPGTTVQSDFPTGSGGYGGQRPGQAPSGFGGTAPGGYTPGIGQSPSVFGQTGLGGGGVSVGANVQKPGGSFATGISASLGTYGGGQSGGQGPSGFGGGQPGGQGPSGFGGGQAGGQGPSSFGGGQAGGQGPSSFGGGQAGGQRPSGFGGGQGGGSVFTGGSNNIDDGDDGSYPGGDYSAIPGEPNIDYPIYASIPDTTFSCSNQQYDGYYADVEARCQVFHICHRGVKYDFLCPNGTIFHQQYFVCVWWNQFECGTAPSFYDLNANIYDYTKTGPAPGTSGQGPLANFPGMGPSGPTALFPGLNGPTGPTANFPGLTGPVGPTANFPGIAGPVGPTANYPGQTGPVGPTANFPSITGPVGPTANYPGIEKRHHLPSLLLGNQV